MATVRIYQKPAGTPVNTSVFAVEILQNNIWYTKKVSWETLKGLIAGAESLTYNNGALTFTTPDGVAHSVLSVDSEVTSGSGNPVSSGAVSTALAGKQDTLTFDQVPTDGSTNPVESNGIYDALAGKQDTLTFDTTPTDGSTNPVTSAGIYAAISAITTGIDWKEAVPTYADIATTYPNPQDGWTVTTLDDDHTYRYTGTEWVDMFSLITLATAQKDGLMSSSDFTKLAGIEAQANKTVVDSAFSASSTNPLQNKVIANKLNTLLDVVETPDTAPYVYRQSPEGQYTVKEQLVGGSVVWNQLVKNGNFADTSNWNQFTASLSVSNNEATVTSTASSGNGLIFQDVNCTNGHKYLFLITAKKQEGITADINLQNAGQIITIDSTSYTTYTKVFEYNHQTAVYTRIQFRIAGQGNIAYFKNCMAIDLTAMLGSTIANYIYTLETQTAGSGVAWFRKYFPNLYYAYSAPTIQSTKVSEKVVKDANDQTVATYDLSGSHVVNRKYALVDFGSLEWTKSISNYGTFYATPTHTPKYISNSETEGETEIYTLVSVNSASSSGDNYIYINGQKRIVVKDTSKQEMTKEQFATAISGYNFLYLVETPYTETVTNPTLYGIWKLDTNNNLYFDGDTVSDIPNPEIVGSTEEFIDAEVTAGNRDVSMPCGGNRKYGNNAYMGQIVAYMTT